VFRHREGYHRLLLPEFGFGPSLDFQYVIFRRSEVSPCQYKTKGGPRMLRGCLEVLACLLVGRTWTDRGYIFDIDGSEGWRGDIAPGIVKLAISCVCGPGCRCSVVGGVIVLGRG